MKIYLASDHAGFELKQSVKEYLQTNHEVEDEGAFSFEKTDDYPDFISKAAEKVSKDELSRAIIFGKSGSGEEIDANKFKNVRAVIGFSKENVRLARNDNDANVLSLGSAFVGFSKAKALIDIFLNTPFSNDKRHKRRLDKIRKDEEQNL